MSWSAEELKLCDELKAYCEAHKLPNMSADELMFECWAVRDGEKSNYIPPAETEERRQELDAAMHWLSNFGERWDAAGDNAVESGLRLFR
jgi:hypothetical protein